MLPDHFTQCIKSISLRPRTWLTSSCSNTLPQNWELESVFNNSMAIYVQADKNAHRLRECSPLTRVLTAYKKAYRLQECLPLARVLTTQELQQYVQR